MPLQRSCGWFTGDFGENCKRASEGEDSIQYLPWDVPLCYQVTACLHCNCQEDLIHFNTCNYLLSGDPIHLFTGSLSSKSALFPLPMTMTSFWGRSKFKNRTLVWIEFDSVHLLCFIQRICFPYDWAIRTMVHFHVLEMNLSWPDHFTPVTILWCIILLFQEST